MNGAALAFAARIVLAAALGVAAVQKLRAMAASREQTVALMGERAGPAVATALPITELAIACALVVWWSIVSGLAAFALLAAFTVVLVRAQTRRLPCPCFGATVATAPPVGAMSIVRNGLLAALAIVATGSPAGATVWAVVVWTIVFGAIAAVAIRAAA
jgi:Methylamine utilisation protein MauE